MPLVLSSVELLTSAVGLKLFHLFALIIILLKMKSVLIKSWRSLQTGILELMTIIKHVIGAPIDFSFF